jgi:hypothetical protein
MIKTEALKLIAKVHGKGCEYQIVETIYSAQDDVPDEVVEQMLEVRRPREYVLYFSEEGLKAIEEACKEFFDYNVGKLGTVSPRGKKLP